MSTYKIDLQLNKKSGNGSILGKVHDFQEQLKEHERRELNILKKSPLSSACDRVVKICNRYSDKDTNAIMFGSNNYLGAVLNEEAIHRSLNVTSEYGIGAGGVPLLTGTNIFQNELEATIAHTKGFDDAILFSSGFTANVGILVGLIRSNHLIVHDRLNHASLIDGSLMSGAKMLRYKHNDPDSLEKILHENQNLYPEGILVVTDGVFSMDGDIANLPAIFDIVNRYNALLLIDDAHATGVIGEKGNGSLSHFNIKGRKNIIVTGTLSKAIGTVGGFITANQELIDYLRIFARSNMYSTALPPSVCASSVEVFKYMKRSYVVERLQVNSEYMRSALKLRNYNILNSETAVIPIIVKDEYKLTNISKYFMDNGIIANYIFPPVVSPNLSRIRLSMMATHTQSDMDYFLSVLDKAEEKFQIR